MKPMSDVPSDRPDGSELTQLLVDQQLGRPFTGPEEWRPIWDQIGLELEALPEGVVVDVPYEPSAPDIDLAAVAAADEQVTQLDAAMRPLPVKVVCWRAATASMFPPDGDPTPYIRHTYQERGFVSVNTDRDRVAVPAGGRLLAVVIPVGTPGVFDETTHELVLQRNLTFKVVSVAANGTVKVVVASG